MTRITCITILAAALATSGCEQPTKEQNNARISKELQSEIRIVTLDDGTVCAVLTRGTGAGGMGVGLSCNWSRQP
jgi:hypothetical protein